MDMKRHNKILQSKVRLRQLVDYHQALSKHQQQSLHLERQLVTHRFALALTFLL